MALKQLILVILYPLLSTVAAVAQERTDSRFLERVSFTVTTAYHRNPWNDYNRAVATVSRQVRQNTFFLYPTGFYEKINGDLTFRGELGFQLTEKLCVLFSGHFGQLNSGFEFFPEASELPPEAGSSPAFHQELNFGVRAIGIGLSYEFPVGKKLALLPKVALERYYGELDLAWRFSRVSVGPIPVDLGEQLSASLDDATWGLNLGIALNWSFHKNISFLAGLEYRRAELDQMQGRAKYGDQLYRGFFDFEAELVQAANYFGVRNLNIADAEFHLPSLTFRTAPGLAARKPAAIDLNAFGLRTGIQLSF